jgi:ComF family protein
VRIVFSSSSDLAPSFRRLFREITGSLLSVAFPASCSLCGEELRDPALTGVCELCWGNIQLWDGPACESCGLPFVSERPGEASTALCSLCRSGAFPLERARSFSVYSGLLRAAILQLKFHRRDRLGKRLGGLLSQVWNGIEEDLEGEAVVLVPVPLHAARQRERGFNQAELLARGLSASLKETRGGRGPEVDARSLVKIRATPPQTGLSVSARHKNVRGAFTVARPERIRDQRLVLVDDVMTTGATLSACARELRSAGARSICALTLARASARFPDTAAGNGAAVVDDFGLGQS